MTDDELHHASGHNQTDSFLAFVSVIPTALLRSGWEFPQFPQALNQLVRSFYVSYQPSELMTRM